MTIFQPTKATILDCSIAGADMTARAISISVFETVCKPYKTGSLVINDDNNVINNLNIRGGEPVAFTFSAGDGLSYTDTLYVLTMLGEPVNNNLRTVRYTIQLIGKEYFGDKSNMVQQSFEKTTGTDIIQAIHSRFIGGGINIPVPSAGLLGGNNAYVVSSLKPFKAINDIRKLITFGSGTGASMYFRDRHQMNLVKIEHLFSNMGSQQTFNQKNTWGSNWQNVLGAYDAILAASTKISETQGRGGIQSIASASQIERKVRDIFSAKKTFSDGMSSAISGLNSVIKSVTGGHGGEQNFPIFDSGKIPKENVRDTGKDRAYQAQIVNGPQLLIKVPIQTGIQCTVGKGVTANLIPPTGDFVSGRSIERNGGNMLVADLTHEISVGSQGIIGTTTMRLVAPPGR